jgi:hypothetical protein
MSRTRRATLARRVVGLACGTLLGLGLSACGLGVDASPRLVNPQQVPFGLLRPSPPTTSPAFAGQYATIYLEGPQRLVAVSRDVPAPVTATRVLAALGQGPTSAEASEGLQSPISTAAPLTIWRLRSTRVTVNVTKAFTTLAGENQAIAVAQLVYTLTALPGIDAVGIRIDGKRAKVPTGKGTLSGGPLDRADYATVAPI